MTPPNDSETWTVWCVDSEPPERLARSVSYTEAIELLKTTDRPNVYAECDHAAAEERPVVNLAFGYNRGLPPGTATAWGCRAIIDQGGLVDVPPDRQSAAGPALTRCSITSTTTYVEPGGSAQPNCCATV